MYLAPNPTSTAVSFWWLSYAHGLGRAGLLAGSETGRQPQYNSSRTSRSSFCDSYERCFRVRVSAGHPEHKEGQFQTAFALYFKSIRAARTAAVHRQ